MPLHREAASLEDHPNAIAIAVLIGRLLAKVGAPVTFTAIVSKHTLVPTGMVSFNSGTTKLGMVELKILGTSSAIAQWTTTFTVAGSSKINAGYA